MAAPKPKPICNGNCFNCPYPDCILEDAAHEDDELVSADIDKALSAGPKRRRNTKGRVLSEEAKQRHREYSRRYDQEHRDRRAAYKKYWYQKNKQQVRERRMQRSIENNYTSVGLEIRRLRKEALLSQSKLAQLVGVALCTIYKWEHGESPPQLDRVIEAINKYKETQD